MAIFQFSEEYRLNLPAIDKQHEEIIALMNLVHERCESKAEHATIVAELEKLIQVTRLHFAVEEAVMQRSSYADLSAHKKAHEMLLARLLAVRDEAHQSKCIPEDTMIFFASWLTTHIRRVDRKYVDPVRTYHATKSGGSTGA